MSKFITTRFRKAIRYATISVGGLARESNYAHVTFDKYLNERPPSAKAALALAKALELRAAMLMEHASRLREAVGEADGVS